MKDYRNFYSDCDLLLLADAFEKFRNNNLKNNGLFPSHFLSATGLSWVAMVKGTVMQFEKAPINGGLLSEVS